MKKLFILQHFNTLQNFNSLKISNYKNKSKIKIEIYFGLSFKLFLRASAVSDHLDQNNI